MRIVPRCTGASPYRRRKRPPLPLQLTRKLLRPLRQLPSQRKVRRAVSRFSPRFRMRAGRNLTPTRT
jgi:hypothetical protein